MVVVVVVLFSVVLFFFPFAVNSRFYTLRNFFDSGKF